MNGALNKQFETHTMESVFMFVVVVYLFEDLIYDDEKGVNNSESYVT